MICARPGCGTVFCYDGDTVTPDGGQPKRYCSRVCMRWHHVERRTGVSLSTDMPACVTRNKGSYPDREQAEADVPVKEAAYGVPLYPYQCPECSRWHLTSQSRSSGLEMAAMIEALARRVNTRP